MEGGVSLSWRWASLLERDVALSWRWASLWKGMFL